jgi:hypothetical protein
VTKTKLWGSLQENDCWESCSAENLLGERVVALQVHAGIVVPYIWLLRERVARQVVVAGIVAPYVDMPIFTALGELLGASLLVELIERVAGQVVAENVLPMSSRPVT